MINIIGFVI